MCNNLMLQASHFYSHNQKPLETPSSRCFELSRMLLTKPSVSSLQLREGSRQLLSALLAKATDENLTSENWEYILVR